MSDHLSAAVAQLAGVNVVLLCCALVLHLANSILRSVAWRGVLVAAFPQGNIRIGRVAGAYCAGVAVNALVPARAGDVVKIGVVRSSTPGSSVPAIASGMGVLSGVDALIGSAVLTTLWATGAIPSIPSPMDLVTGLADMAYSMPEALIIGGAAIGAVGVVSTRWLTPRLRHFVRQLGEGIRVARSPRRYVSTVLPFQLGAWVVRVTSMLLLLAAFGLPAHPALAAAVVTGGGIASLVPTPGGIGAHQAMLVLLMHGAVPAANVVAFSVTVQALTAALNIIIGTMAMMWMVGTMRPAAAVRHCLRLGRSGGRSTLTRGAAAVEVAGLPAPMVACRSAGQAHPAMASSEPPCHS
jgi:hypothetical protein